MEPAGNDALAMTSVPGLLMMDGEVAAIVPSLVDDARAAVVLAEVEGEVDMVDLRRLDLRREALLPCKKHLMEV